MVESIRRVTKTADGEITATSMLERFGFTGDRLTARIGDLSGGERRRFQLLLLLLDRAQRAAPRRAHQRPRHRDPQRARGLPRRLARHPRRGLPRPLLPRAGHRLGLGAARRRPDLDAAPRRRRVPRAPGRRPSRRRAEPGSRSTSPAARPGDAGAAGAPKAKAGSAEERAARKNVARIDKQLERIAEPEAELNAEVLEHAQDYEKLAELSAELERAGRRRRTSSSWSGWRPPSSLE